MKNLLENDLPAFYGVGRRCICDENTTSLSEPQIEQFGFDYYRISHDYSFKIDNDSK